MITELHSEILRQSWPSLVGMAFTCPRCGGILDARLAVGYDVYKGDQLAVSKIYCAPCADAYDLPAFAEKLESEGFRLEVTDGRKLFPPKPPAAPRAPRKKASERTPPQVGDRYLINHTSGRVTVRIVGTRVHRHFDSHIRRTYYDCINEKTGRAIVVKSATRFKEIPAPCAS